MVSSTEAWQLYSRRVVGPHGRRPAGLPGASVSSHRASIPVPWWGGGRSQGGGTTTLRRVACFGADGGDGEPSAPPPASPVEVGAWSDRGRYDVTGGKRAAGGVGLNGGAVAWVDLLGANGAAANGDVEDATGDANNSNSADEGIFEAANADGEGTDDIYNNGANSDVSDVNPAWVRSEGGACV